MASTSRNRSSAAGSSQVRSVFSPGVSRKILGFVVASSLATFAYDVNAQAFAGLPDSITTLQTVGGARPVPAWNEFCSRFPAECAVDTRESSSIILTADVWQTIARINREVNTAIKPLTDHDQWRVVDSWDFPTTGYGDCEDYQLLKRQRLVAAGLPKRALRMTVVLDELNEGHAVLKVMTDRGDFVLDNKTNAILPWDRTGYVYIKREGQDGTAWVSLGGAVASPTAVASAER